MFWDGWQDIARIIILALLTYPALIFMLRISGKRTLSKFNAFDFVITIAFGSTIAAILLNSNVSYAEGLTALAMLILLQFIVTWLSVRSPAFQRLVKSEPVLLFHDGQYMKDVMRRERITRAEILAALRENQQSEHTAHAVILETDGTFSVLPEKLSGDSTSSIYDPLKNHN